MTDNNIFNKSLNKALNGGLSGFSAMTIQVSSLMWLRTTMNYQYRYGGTTTSVIKKLYNENGIRRFYRGYFAALSIGPLARFGDTASNTYVMSILENKNVSTPVKTGIGSLLASSVRIFLMPLDTIKTTLQVEGKDGLSILKKKVTKNNFKIMFHGTGASVTATFVGHYPWFLTYNILNDKIPHYNNKFHNHIRNGFIGFNAAVISDCFSNSFRVIKTNKQTSQNNISYKNVVKNILNKEGIKGLMGRGLKTRIITNGTQGILFTILWKHIEELLQK